MRTGALTWSRDRPRPREGADEHAVAARRARISDRRGVAVDAAVVVALGVASFVTRVDGLPGDGLWHDDAWVSTGAIHGHVSQLIMVGSGHPGFTGLLMAVSRVTGANSSAMAWPAFAAGVLGAPLLYLALRRFGFGRAIGSLCAAALVVSDVDVLYSGRVKPYAFDVLVVLGLVVLLPRLARLHWTWPIALGWTTFAVAVGFFNGFALLATAIAGALLVVYARSDRWTRLAAVAVQAAAQLVIYVELQRASNLAELERAQEGLYDGHLTFSWNPIKLGREVLHHFDRVVNVYPGGPSWLLPVLSLVVVVGLVSAVIDRKRTARALRAQYLGLLLLMAIVLGFADRFPFGAGRGFVLSRGERSTLWLVPVVAFGLAAALQWVRGLVGRARWPLLAFDVVIVAVALVVVVSAVGEEAPPYPFSGAESATHLIENRLGKNDVVVLPGVSTMPYAVETRSGVTLHATPQRTIGFAPTFTDPRIHAFGLTSLTPATPAAIRTSVRGADRVYMFVSIPGFGPDQQTIVTTLRRAGFRMEDTIDVNHTQVVVWRSSVAG
jgi:hypothetical protein